MTKDNHNSFFITGGTLSPDSPSYVERQADFHLLEALKKSEYCFVLDSRQKGKSSLMGRTIEKLKASQIQTVKLDLQRYGANLDAERWYAGLLNTIGQELGVSKELFAFWAQNQNIGPLQRWTGAIENVILSDETRNVVIFIDEIDFIRSLPFPTDEFLAGIRECYNRRTENPAFKRLTFCLLGVATPSELIQDVRITPFNIGKRIELTDFTIEELTPYASALSTDGRDGHALIKRIHYWTGGHPYLTQKLAQAVAEEPTITNKGGVDRLVEETFFTIKARRDEPNLSDVARRVLESSIEGISTDEARARILDLYQRVREAKRSVKDDETDPIVSILKLSGLTTVLEGYLVVRNRIYFRAFDKAWIKAGLPEDEEKRQRRAARKAALRVTLIAGAITLAIGGMAVYAVYKAKETERALAKAKEKTRESQIANQNLEAKQIELERSVTREKASSKDAKQQRDVAIKNEALAKLQTKRAEDMRDLAEKKQTLYLAAKNAAEKGTREAKHSAYIAGLMATRSAARANEWPQVVSFVKEGVVENYSNKGWEYGYWNRELNLQLPIRSIQHEVSAASPDGKEFAVAIFDGSVAIWSSKPRQPIDALRGHEQLVVSIAYSKDGSRILTGSDDKTARVWDAKTRKCLSTHEGYVGEVSEQSFSQDLSKAVTAIEGNKAQVWNAKTGKNISTFEGHEKIIQFVSLSPDGRRVVTASWDGTARVWDADTGKPVIPPLQHANGVNSARFSHDGKAILTGSSDGTAQLWDAQTGANRVSFLGHTKDVWHAEFSPDETKVLTASWDGTARLWDVATGECLSVLKGHPRELYHASFSPDGKLIRTVSMDGVTRIWSAASGHSNAEVNNQIGTISETAFSKDGNRVVTCTDHQTAAVWDARTGKILFELKGHKGRIWSAAYSPNGRFIVTASEDGTARVWNAQTGGCVKQLNGHVGIVRYAGFSPDGKWILTGGFDKRARIWDAKSGQCIKELTDNTDVVRYVGVSPDGKRIVTASGKEAILRDAKSFKQIKTMPISTFGRLVVPFSPDSRSLLTMNGTSSYVCNATSGEQELTLSQPGQGASSATFSPDGRLIVTTSGENHANVWDAKTGDKLTTLVGHNASIVTATFSPDSQRIVTAGMDGSARVWDAESGKELATLSGFSGQVIGVAFSPNGSRLLTTSMDNTARMWYSKVGDGPPYCYGTDLPLDYIAKELTQSASRGDLYAWRWQIKHWTNRTQRKKQPIKDAIARATESTNPELAREAKNL